MKNMEIPRGRNQIEVQREQKNISYKDLYSGHHKEQYKKYHKCRNCGLEFITKYKIRKYYCSEECIKEWRNSHAQRVCIPNREKIIKINKTSIECKQCEKIFFKKTCNNIFCSKECLKIHDKNKYKRISLGLEKSKGKMVSFLKLRFEIFKRNNFMCQYCGRSPRKDKCRLMIDHVIPRSKGGTNEPNNLITSCEECNLGKADCLLKERMFQKLNIIKIEDE